MNMEPNLKVVHAENGLPLIQFLADRLAISRNMAKEIIDQRRVFINGRRTWMARHRLEKGDRITGGLGLEKERGVRSAPVIYEDHDYLIVNKPAGIESNGKNSLEQSLKEKTGLPELAACHRLDKDTSGCLIFAKHHKAKERIIFLFARSRIFKKYDAIVRGRLPAKSITITKPIEGRKAVTHVRTVDSTPAASHASGVASHVSISIETGRTHQIRKHLASIGHPVLGDQRYGVGREVPQGERLIERQMLHASEIKFIQPFTEKPVGCKASLPADLKECLRQYHLK